MYIFEDNEAVIKMIIKGRIPQDPSGPKGASRLRWHPKSTLADIQMKCSFTKDGTSFSTCATSLMCQLSPFVISAFLFALTRAGTCRSVKLKEKTMCAALQSRDQCAKQLLLRSHSDHQDTVILQLTVRAHRNMMQTTLGQDDFIALDQEPQIRGMLMQVQAPFQLLRVQWGRSRFLNMHDVTKTRSLTQIFR